MVKNYFFCNKLLEYTESIIKNYKVAKLQLLKAGGNVALMVRAQPDNLSSIWISARLLRFPVI